LKRGIGAPAPQEAHAENPRNPTGIIFVGNRHDDFPDLSVIKQWALILCLEGDGTLHKRSGAWTLYPESHEARVSGVTVADLARDGLLTIVMREKRAYACLTPRGAWFARTAEREHHCL
jgi:hypothetical protein